MACDCCELPQIHITLLAKSRSAGAQLPWCGFGEFQVEGQDYNWDIKYREETTEYYSKTDYEVTTESFGRNNCHETQLEEEKRTHLRAYEPEDDEYCTVTNYGEIDCASQVQFNSSGKSGDFTWSGSLSGSYCDLDNIVESCTEDGVVTDSYCGCNPGQLPLISHTTTNPPAVTNPKIEKYTTEDCFIRITGFNDALGSASAQETRNSWTLKKLDNPNPKPQEGELVTELDSNLESTPWQDNAHPYIYYTYSKTEKTHAAPSVGGREIKLIFKHPPTPTCYLKVWIKGVANERTHANPTTPYTETSAYDDVYEWEVEGECWDSIGMPRTITSDEDLFYFPYPTASIGAIWFRIFKYSFVKDYEPGDPVFIAATGQYIRPVDDEFPNGTPFGDH